MASWREGGWFAQPGWSTAHRIRPAVVPPTTLCGRVKRDGWTVAGVGARPCICCLRCRKASFTLLIPGRRLPRADVIYRPASFNLATVDVHLPAVAHV